MGLFKALMTGLFGRRKRVTLKSLFRVKKTKRKWRKGRKYRRKGL